MGNKRGARPIPTMKVTDIQAGKLKGSQSGKHHKGDSLTRMGQPTSNFKKIFPQQAGKSAPVDTDE